MSELNLPRQFGKYVLTRKIAMGGMAEIFKAKTAGAEGFEKEIVIKRILPHFTDDEAFVKMFIDEASITSKLQHANIVQIFDFDVSEGSYYIAMEYVDGTDLKDVIDDGIKKGTPLSVAQCAWILMELSKGLHYAHTKEHKGKPLNIVHRDISPHNAMVSYNGEVKLMDFGIAKAAQRSTKTMAGTVKGKVAYMSPEQARGKPLDGRSDLFALGIMMWEMLTNKRLFLGDSDFETLTAVLKTDAPPPSSINPGVPPEIDAIVLKALEKDRDQRYPNVEAFNRELTRWYYSNVVDLEKESLKNFLRTLYADKIAHARELNAQDKQLPDAVENLDQERTLAMPIDPQAAATLLDDGSISQKHIQEAMAAQKKKAEEEAAVAAPVGTGTFTNKGFTGTYAGQIQTEHKGKGLLIAIAALLFLGAGGFAAWYFTQDKGGDDKVEEVQPETVTMAELVISVDPPEAKVRVNGAVVDGKTEVEKGKTATVIAEAPGYETFEEFVPMSKSTQVIKIELKKERATVQTIVEVDNAEATIKVNGEDRQSNKTILEGREGDKVKLEIVHKGKVVKTQEIVLDPKDDILNIESGTVAPKPDDGATLILTVSPTLATVTPSKGEVDRGPDGQVIIKGLSLNDVVSIEVSQPNYTTESKTFTVNSENFAAGKISLSRKSGGGGASANTGDNTTAKVVTPPKAATVVSGDGFLTVTANPWAKVSIDGKPVGNSPVERYKLSAGTHNITFSKGAVTKTKTVKVRAGKTSTLRIDMDE